MLTVASIIVNNVVRTFFSTKQEQMLFNTRTAMKHCRRSKAETYGFNAAVPSANLLLSPSVSLRHHLGFSVCRKREREEKRKILALPAP